MMSARQTAIELIATAWSQAITREQLALYAEFTSDIADDELLAAVRQLVLAEDHRPAIARIRRTVIEKRAQFPSDGDAWLMAVSLDESESVVHMGAGTAPPPVRVHPAVRAAYDAAGIAHQPTFRRAYIEACAQLVADAAGASLAGPLALEEAARG